jgi:hypothetical protein
MCRVMILQLVCTVHSYAPCRGIMMMLLLSVPRAFQYCCASGVLQCTLLVCVEHCCHILLLLHVQVCLTVEEVSLVCLSEAGRVFQAACQAGCCSPSCCRLLARCTGKCAAVKACEFVTQLPGHMFIQAC